MGKIGMFFRNLWSLRTLGHVIESFGVLWLVVEIASFFSPPLGVRIKCFWWLFLFLGFVVAVWRAWPRLRFNRRLGGRDVVIEIAVTDLLRENADVVIGTNRVFVTQIAGGPISQYSIQGQVTKRYFSNSKQLDQLIAAQLKGQSGVKVKTFGGSRNEYEAGTVCRVDLPGTSHTSYWVAISKMNESGNCQGSLDDFLQALPKLWQFIVEKGVKGRLCMPILGSGFSRLTLTRNELTRHIIESFMAACSESVPIDHLTICINPADVAKGHVDIDELEAFLDYKARFTVVAQSSKQGIGNSIS